MKKLCIVLFMLLLGFGINAQDKQYSLMITYEMFTASKAIEVSSGTLYLNADRAYYSYGYKEKMDESQQQNSENDKDFVVLDTSQYFIKSDRLQQTLIQLEPSYLNKSIYVVEEEYPSIEWDLKDTSKMIGNALCFQARATFAGKMYTAWFNPQIPCYFGPWKFHGLPGAILELSDDAQQVRFTATKIKSIDLSPELIENQAEYVAVDRAEYNDKVKLFTEDLEKIIKTKAGRGVTVKVKINTENAIEKNEN